MKLPTIKNERLYQKIANLIVELIENGTFKRGEYLPAERELSKSIGVSRSSLREALVALEISGLIEIQSGAGIFVRNPVNQDNEYLLADLLNARKLVDGETSYYAAFATEESKKKLTDIHLLMNFYLETNKISEFYQADRDFHMLIAKLSNNKVFVDIADMLWNKPLRFPYVKTKVETSDLKIIKQFHQQHERIIQAIVSDNADEAKAQAIKHVEFVKSFWLENRE